MSEHVMGWDFEPGLVENFIQSSASKYEPAEEKLLFVGSQGLPK